MSTNSNPTALAGLIRETRRAAGMTRQELAARAGCSVSYLQLLEGGFAPNRSDVLARVQEVLASAPQNDHDPADNRAVGKVGDDDARDEV